MKAQGHCVQNVTQQQMTNDSEYQVATSPTTVTEMRDHETKEPTRDAVEKKIHAQ